MINISPVLRTDRNLPTLQQHGTVESIGDGIALVIGLTNIQAGEMVKFVTIPRRLGDKGWNLLTIRQQFVNQITNGANFAVIFARGMAINLNTRNVSIIVFENDRLIQAGDLVLRTGSVVSLNTGKITLGRVLDPLGIPIDGKGPLVKQEPTTL